MKNQKVTTYRYRFIKETPGDRIFRFLGKTIFAYFIIGLISNVEKRNNKKTID